MLLVDKWGRELRNLRISVTSSCNYHCIYCHREGLVNDGYGLLAEEYKAIAYVATSLGIREFKITGGEPLIRKDILEIVKAISDHKPNDLSMTTNGYWLELYAEKLAEAGLKRVNVSVPSLNRERYKYVTGLDALDKVLRGLKTALDAGLNPVTINVVVLNGVNDNEYKDFIELASSHGYRLRFIELEPISVPNTVFKKLYKPLNNITKYLEEVAVRKYFRDLHHRPVYILDVGTEVEVVKWLHNAEFCMHCNRIRLTANGILLPCIMSTKGIDLKPFLKPYIDLDGIRKAFIAVNELRHPFNTPYSKQFLANS
ncbi:MAG: GTP 3',8-cyclase MoaA [Ignisphaera sp.]